MIRLFIVEDNAVVRMGLANLLAQQPDFEIAGTAAGSFEALQWLDNGLLPDVIITDLNMPGIDGLALARRLLGRHCAARVIILTMHRQPTFVEKALAAGVRGYLLKGEDVEDLFSGIRAVHSGKTYISPKLRV